MRESVYPDIYAAESGDDREVKVAFRDGVNTLKLTVRDGVATEGADLSVWQVEQLATELAAWAHARRVSTAITKPSSTIASGGGGRGGAGGGSGVVR